MNLPSASCYTHRANFNKCCTLWCQVGGDFTDTVMLKHMKIGARAVIVGAISLYNVQDPHKGEYEIDSSNRVIE